jgi:hypothetical protein
MNGTKTEPTSLLEQAAGNLVGTATSLLNPVISASAVTSSASPQTAMPAPNVRLSATLIDFPSLGPRFATLVPLAVAMELLMTPRAHACAFRTHKGLGDAREQGRVRRRG